MFVQMYRPTKNCQVIAATLCLCFAVRAKNLKPLVRVVMEILAKYTRIAHTKVSKKCNGILLYMLHTAANVSVKNKENTSISKARWHTKLKNWLTTFSVCSYYCCL